MKEIDRKYNIILNEVSRKSPYEFDSIVDLDYIPDFMNDKSKYKYTDKNQAINIELTEKATDKDKKDYIKYKKNRYFTVRAYYNSKNGNIDIDIGLRSILCNYCS